MGIVTEALPRERRSHRWDTAVMKLTLSPDVLALNKDFAELTKPKAKRSKTPLERPKRPLPASDSFPPSYFQFCPFTCPEHGVYVRYGVSQWLPETGNIGKLVFVCGCVVTRPIKGRG